MHSRRGLVFRACLRAPEAVLSLLHDRGGSVAAAVNRLASPCRLWMHSPGQNSLVMEPLVLSLSVSF